MEHGPGVKRGRGVRKPSGPAWLEILHPSLVTLVSVRKSVGVGVVEEGLVPVTPWETLSSGKIRSKVSRDQWGRVRQDTISPNTPYFSKSNLNWNDKIQDDFTKRTVSVQHDCSVVNLLENRNLVMHIMSYTKVLDILWYNLYHPASILTSLTHFTTYDNSQFISGFNCYQVRFLIGWKHWQRRLLPYMF